jgi:hypothetical protein
MHVGVTVVGTSKKRQKDILGPFRHEGILIEERARIGYYRRRLDNIFRQLVIMYASPNTYHIDVLVVGRVLPA